MGERDEEKELLGGLGDNRESRQGGGSGRRGRGEGAIVSERG